MTEESQVQPEKFDSQISREDSYHNATMATEERLYVRDVFRNPSLGRREDERREKTGKSGFEHETSEEKLVGSTRRSLTPIARHILKVVTCRNMGKMDQAWVAAATTVLAVSDDELNAVALALNDDDLKAREQWVSNRIDWSYSGQLHCTKCISRIIDGTSPSFSDCAYFLCFLHILRDKLKCRHPGNHSFDSCNPLCAVHTKATRYTYLRYHGNYHAFQRAGVAARKSATWRCDE